MRLQDFMITMMMYPAIRMQPLCNAILYKYTYMHSYKHTRINLYVCAQDIKYSIISGGTNNNFSTPVMVLMLVGVVKGVFVCFALMAVCYRYSNSEQMPDQGLSVFVVVVIRG